MMIELDETLTVLDAFNRHGVEYVLVGGIAAIFLGIGRTTEDIDLFVRPTESNVAAIREALRDIYPGDDSIDEIKADDLGGPYPTVRYGPPHGRFYVDLMARLGDAFRYDDVEWQAITFENVSIRIATPRTLYRMKRDTVRARDRADADALRELYPDEIGD
jgi:hypothetical protein